MWAESRGSEAVQEGTADPLTPDLTFSANPHALYHNVRLLCLVSGRTRSDPDHEESDRVGLLSRARRVRSQRSVPPGQTSALCYQSYEPNNGSIKPDCLNYPKCVHAQRSGGTGADPEAAEDPRPQPRSSQRHHERPPSSGPALTFTHTQR